MVSFREWNESVQESSQVLFFGEYTTWIAVGIILFIVLLALWIGFRQKKIVEKKE